MKILARILMYLTLWCDLNLILGVLFTGQYGHMSETAQITVGGFSVNSATHDGAVFIMIIAMWTGLLAICGLLGLRNSRPKCAALSP